MANWKIRVVPLKSLQVHNLIAMKMRNFAYRRDLTLQGKLEISMRSKGIMNRFLFGIQGFDELRPKFACFGPESI